jgi:LysM repeat protein
MTSKNGLPRLTSLLAALLLTGLLLSGCNMPQQTNPTFRSSQRQTEVAGILNPEGLVTAGAPDATGTAPAAAVEGYLTYTTRQGDTLDALGLRFGVPTGAIQFYEPGPADGLLQPGQTLLIPDTLEDTLNLPSPLLPDSAVTYGPTVGDFDAAEVARLAGGFLAGYSESVKGETLTGPEIVATVAIETSTNPRLLLVFLEYRSGWVFGSPAGANQDPYPLGFGAGADTGLYKELMIAAKLLAQGFYGWRDGSLLELVFSDGTLGRLDPMTVNAGSAALMQLFAMLYDPAEWQAELFDPGAFMSFYEDMFGDPRSRADRVEPYLLASTRQPELTLPFAPGEPWSLTGGPHITWQTGTPWGAIDFAPVTGEEKCAVSIRWATAAAPGLVVRSERGVVAIDLDGDGDESTGWVLIYLHMAAEGRAQVGDWLAQDAPVGHPSCEGGSASGSHLHLARKFNGEWVGVGDPLPLVLDGWQAVAGAARYQGSLVRGNETITASPTGSAGSLIYRDN